MTPPSIGTLDRYLLRQLLPPFIIALCTVLAALLLERLLILMNDLASEGSSASTFFALLTDLLPHYLGLALPAALCISVFIIIKRMSEESEIDALMASGLSLSRITRPFMWVGLLLGAASLFLYGYIQPVARYDFRSGFYLAAHAGWVPHLQAGMFATTSDNAVLTADRVAHNGSMLHNVFIRTLQKDGSERVITARRGRITTLRANRRTFLDLWDGEIITQLSPATSRLKRTTFAHSTRLFVPGKSDETFRSRGKDERELTLRELIHRLATSHQYLKAPAGVISRSNLRAEFDFRIARAVAIPFIPLLTTALAVGAKRRRPVIAPLLLALTLLGFDHILQFGNGLVATNRLPGLIAIWVPEFLFCLLCVTAIRYRSQGGWQRPRSRPYLIQQTKNLD